MSPRKPAAPESAPETPETTSPTDLMDGAEDAPSKEAEANMNGADAGTAPVETVVTDVAIYDDKPKALSSLQDYGTLMEEDADQDLGFGKDDIAVPIVRVLQSNSPQVKRQNAKFIEGAESGFFINTALNEVYDGQDGIDIVPVIFRRQATLWTPRGEGGAGGGFEGEIDIAYAEQILKTGTRKNDKKKDITTVPVNTPMGQKPAGLELSIAAMYLCLQIMENGSVRPIAFPLASTQMKKARAWNAVMSQSRLPSRSGVGSYQPKMYGYLYHVSTIPEANASGDWMGVKIVQGAALLKFVNGQVTEGFPGAAQVYEAARALEKQFSEGNVKVRQDDNGGDFDVTVEGAPVPDGEDEKLPY